MNLAILFWFYKDLEVCHDRLRLLRAYDPDTPRFGLYGGSQDQAPDFKSHLSPYLDDFYEYSSQKSDEWKWLNGDLLIAEWYRERGQYLSWDTVVVVQWDMLVFGKVSELFSEVSEGEILLSGLRSVEEVAAWWNWTTQEEHRYLDFLDHVKQEYDYKGTPVCGQFVVVCLPRQFLERYVELKKPELGFIEYRMPIYAQIFGVPFCRSKRFESWWAGEPRSNKTPWREVTLTADKYQIPFSTVRANLSRPDGARVFHPFDARLPINPDKAPELSRESEQRKRVIFVLGLASTGASVISAALARMGVDFGDERRFLDMSIYAHNSKDSCELRWINRLNDEILSHLEASWRSRDSRSFELFDPSHLRECELRIQESVEKEWGSNISLIGIKDAGISLLFPLWKSVFLKMGYEVKCIVTVRDPLGYQTLENQPQPVWPNESFLWDWLKHLLSDLFCSEGCDTRVVDFDRFNSGPDSVIGELCQWLEFDAIDASTVSTVVGELSYYHNYDKFERTNHSVGTIHDSLLSSAGRGDSREWAVRSYEFFLDLWPLVKVQIGK